MSTKRKLPQKIAQPKASQSAKVLGKGNLDESRAVVSSGGNDIKSRVNGVKEVVDISSDEEVDSDPESADEQDEAQPANGEDVSMGDADSPAEAPVADDAEENGETGARAKSRSPSAASSRPVASGGRKPKRMTSLAESPTESAPMIRFPGRNARPTSSGLYPSTSCR